MLDVIAFGEAMIELTMTDDGSADVGVAGDTFNTAVYLKRSAPDLSVGYATRLGTDPMSDRIAAAMSREDLDLHLTIRGDGLPGLYAISTDGEGERSFYYWRGTSAARRVLGSGGLALEDLAKAKVLYLSAISIAILPEDDRIRLLEWLPEARDNGLRIAFDSNYRPALWPDLETAQHAVSTVWQATDIGLPSIDDEMMLFGDETEHAVVARLQDWGVKTGAMKRGADGPRNLKGGTPPVCPKVANVVDSTAAGDSFNGGYLAALLSGKDEDAAMLAGHALASRVIGKRGAIIPREAS